MIKRNRKKGYSLVEVVISLAVIVVVSVTALSIALSSVTAKKTATNKTYALFFADNVWESFKAADDSNEFLSFVEFSNAVTLTDGVTDELGVTTYTYESKEHKFTAEIAVSFSDVARDELQITARDSDGEEIISFSYSKSEGGGI